MDTGFELVTEYGYGEWSTCPKCHGWGCWINGERIRCGTLSDEKALLPTVPDNDNRSEPEE